MQFFVLLSFYHCIHIIEFFLVFLSYRIMEGQDHDREEVTQPNEGQYEHIADYNNEREKAKKLVKRGRTVMKEVISQRYKGIKFKVTWNEENQPIGRESKLLIVYIGVVVRKTVPSTLKDWRYLSPDIPKAILREILVSNFSCNYV